MRRAYGCVALAMGLFGCARPAQPTFSEDALEEFAITPETGADVLRAEVMDARAEVLGVDGPAMDSGRDGGSDGSTGLDLAMDRSEASADSTVRMDSPGASDTPVTSDTRVTTDGAVTTDGTVTTDSAVMTDSAVTRDILDAPPLRRVDHCYVSDPAVMEVIAGAAAPLVAAQVFVAGVTSGAGAGSGVTVEIGSGPGGIDPLASASWLWTGAMYERDVDGVGASGSRDYDRFRASPPPRATPGEYAYAARARVGLGPWLACDLVSRIPHGYEPVFAGRMTVALAGAPRVAFCNLQFPRMMSAVSGMFAAMPAYGRVFAAGVTDRGCADRPSAGTLTAQLGVGVSGSFPSDATWAWTEGLIEGHRDSVQPLGEGDCHNLEYRAVLRAPALCSPHSYAWRFRRESGPWTYCRWAPPAMDAPTTPTWEVYDPALAGSLSVTGCL